MVVFCRQREYNMVERPDVVGFLNLFKGCMILDLFHVRDREKNLQGLLDLGMDIAERKEVLLSLEPEDYVKGPEPDDTGSDKEVWFFGKEYNGKEIYIKLRVVRDTKKKNLHRALIWSFHPAENKLNYPFADK